MLLHRYILVTSRHILSKINSPSPCVFIVHSLGSFHMAHTMYSLLYACYSLGFNICISCDAGYSPGPYCTLPGAHGIPWGSYCVLPTAAFRGLQKVKNNSATGSVFLRELGWQSPAWVEFEPRTFWSWFKHATTAPLILHKSFNYKRYKVFSQH